MKSVSVPSRGLGGGSNVIIMTPVITLTMRFRPLARFRGELTQQALERNAELESFRPLARIRGGLTRLLRS